MLDQYLISRKREKKEKKIYKYNKIYDVIKRKNKRYQVYFYSNEIFIILNIITQHLSFLAVFNLKNGPHD